MTGARVWGLPLVQDPCYMASINTLLFIALVSVPHPHSFQMSGAHSLPSSLAMYNFGQHQLCRFSRGTLRSCPMLPHTAYARLHVRRTTLSQTLKPKFAVFGQATKFVMLVCCFGVALLAGVGVPHACQAEVEI